MDLDNYLEIRESRDKPDKTAAYLFLAPPVGRKGTNRRLNQRSMEKLVEKYAIAFGNSVLTLHALRHSFANRFHKENNDVPRLRIQKGHRL